MSEVPVFFIAPNGQTDRFLRRYQTGECPGSKYNSYHNAQVPLDRVDWPNVEGVHAASAFEQVRKGDLLWPTKCDKCDHQFTEAAEYQIVTQTVYADKDGKECYLRTAPVGAVWDATWYHELWFGPDGRSLVVKLPGNHDWCIDSPANNCTLPDDKEHRCWVRHGRPEDGTLHVDKDGKTCSAGGGSIAIPNYHGFLHNGKLTDVP